MPIRSGLRHLITIRPVGGTVVDFEKPLLLQPDRGYDFIVPEYITAWPITLGDQFFIEADRFVLLRIVLGHDRQSGLFLKIFEDRHGELAILGAVQHHARLGARTAGAANEQKHAAT